MALCFWIFILSLVIKAEAQEEKNGGGKLETEQQVPPSCVDLSNVCESWARYCQTLSDGTFQTYWCPRTCGRCKRAAVLADAAPNLPTGTGGVDGSGKATESSTTTSTTASTTGSSLGSSSGASSASTGNDGISGGVGTSTSRSTSGTPSTSTSASISSNTSASSSALLASSSSAAPNSSGASVLSSPQTSSAPNGNGSAVSDEKSYQCQADYRLLPKLSEDNLKLAVSLYKIAIDDTPKDNIVFSPTSIAIGMAAMEIGARSSAKEELHKFLSPSLSGEEESLAYAALMGSLRGEGGQAHQYNLHLTNALYVDNNFPISKEFSENATKCFDVVTGNLDFQRKSDASRLQINEWVQDHAEYKFRNFFPPSGINSDDRMVLINLVNLFGEWANSFTNGRTYNRLFYPPGNAPGVEVAMMSMEANFRFYEQSDLQVLGIDYKQHELTLFILLPTNREGLSQIERALDAKELQRLMNAAQDQKVDATIPKFAINYRLKLKEALQALGVKLLFDISSDMTGISKKRDLFMSEAVHQAVFKVSENGTETAASSGAFVDRDDKTKFLLAEHAFMFLVRHNPSTSVIFAGRVTDPGKGVLQRTL